MFLGDLVRYGFCAAAFAAAMAFAPNAATATGSYDMRAMMGQPYPLAIRPPAMMFTIPGQTAAPATAVPAPAPRAVSPTNNPYVPVTQWQRGSALQGTPANRIMPAAAPRATANAPAVVPAQEQAAGTSGSSTGFANYLGWGAGGTWNLEIQNEDRGPLEGFNGNNETGHLTWAWRLAYTSDKQNPPWFQDLRQWLGWPGNGWNARVSYGIEQAAYAKNSIRADNNFPDRPYAGVLMAGARINLSKPFSGAYQQNDFLELGAGVVGDASGAESLHRVLHNSIDRGSRIWRGELDSEPVVLIGYEKGLRAVYGWDKWLEVELNPYVNAQVGNMFTTGSAGLMVRLGRQLKRDTGAPRIRYLLQGESFPEHDNYWTWNIFAGAEQKAVAWNIFTDGNTYRDTSDVTTRPFVQEFTTGAELGYGAYRMTLTHVYRTEEFEEQVGQDRFVRLALSARF